MINARLLSDPISHVLKPHGFQKKDSNWRRAGEGVVVLVNLQKSAWGEDWYINCGFWISMFGDNPSPLENKCHVRIRSASLPGVDTYRLEHVLSSQVLCSEEERRDCLKDHIENELLPFLVRASTLDGLLEMVRQGLFRRAFVHRKVQELIEECKREMRD